MLQFWQEGVSAWYDEDYLTAMSVWQAGLDNIVEPIQLPWQSGSSKDNCPKNETNQDVSDNVAVLAPLYLFLAGCYLDAQDFDMAEKSCRQGLNAILRNSNPHECNADTKETAIRLVQEIMSCWEENPAVTAHCQQARFLLEWLNQEYPAIVGAYWPDPWQRPAFVYPNLPSQAVCPRQHHPAWCAILEKEFSWIQQECQAYFSHNAWRNLPQVGQGDHRQGAGAHDGSVVNTGTGDWREAVLFGAGESPHVAPQTRQWLQTHCPDTVVSLARQGGGEVIVSVLAPHTRIAPHCASTNLRWTAHLGLRVPTTTSTMEGGRGVKIRIADQWLSWEEGRILVFDDSYEHEVVNDSDEIRVVLLLRFWNPHLTLAERRKALPMALQWKEQEQERRFHPPTPPVS